jgi:orotidine 5'-phosphate decarboxylase subfamily 1
MNPTAKRLLATMQDKQSNLSLAADFTTSRELLYWAELLGDAICLLKLHIDILEDFTPEVIEKLVALSKKKRFLLFEDRKFADIGNTVLHQYGKGLYKIASWADIVNAHIIPGPGIIEGLKHVGGPLGRGLLLLAEMSSKGTLTDHTYAQRAYAMALQFPDFVIGFISQRKLGSDPHLLTFTPGIHLHATQDALGQQYRSPEQAIRDGADILIVGRAITEAKDPKHEAALYAQAGWQARQASHE